MAQGPMTRALSNSGDGPIHGALKLGRMEASARWKLSGSICTGQGFWYNTDHVSRQDPSKRSQQRAIGGIQTQEGLGITPQIGVMRLSQAPVGPLDRRRRGPDFETQQGQSLGTGILWGGLAGRRPLRSRGTLRLAGPTGAAALAIARLSRRSTARTITARAAASLSTVVSPTIPT